MIFVALSLLLGGGLCFLFQRRLWSEDAGLFVLLSGIIGATVIILVMGAVFQIYAFLQ
jgi:hypothetical protein